MQEHIKLEDKIKSEKKLYLSKYRSRYWTTTTLLKGKKKTIVETL